MKTLSSDQRVEHLQKIQSAYNKCKEYSDDKVQLAMQTYEMVSAGCPRHTPRPTRRGTLPRAAGQAEARLGPSDAAREGAPWRDLPPGGVGVVSCSAAFRLVQLCVCIYIYFCCLFLSALGEALGLALATSLSGLPHLRLMTWHIWGSV